MNKQVSNQKTDHTSTLHKTVTIDGLSIFYRESGEPTNPKMLLLHGWPSSSHQYRNLIPALADHFHIVAPDYPGLGNRLLMICRKINYSSSRPYQLPLRDQSGPFSPMNFAAPSVISSFT
jgi:pimeloyl-ACP methyl ester carboxylesterase